LKGLSN